MDLTRRGFFKATAAALMGSIAYEVSSQSQAFAVETDDDWKLVNTEEYTNICCYCSGGCGSVVSVRDGEVINIEGDPDHPINEGGLCPKGAAMFQLRNVVDPDTGEVIHNPNRATHPMVRRPGKSEWEQISWDEAIEGIARHVKDTRDKYLIEKNDDGLTVNRLEAVASLGGSQQNSEEEYAILKIMRGIGCVGIDNQARVCHSSTVAGLAPVNGRGSMTNHYADIQNTDVILHCGSNSVECHPVTSKWLNRAREKGAKWIVVDPRYTRTAEMADLYCPIRSGTDIAFYGGMFNYIIENDLWQHEYVLNYTNASYLVREDYDFDPETGLFSGWNPETKSYDRTSWGYQVESDSQWDTSEGGAYSWVNDPGVPKFTTPTLHHVKKDPTLQDPHCVFQIMKKHYSRYTLDAVCDVCGMDKETLEEVYKLYCSTGAPDKSGTIIYALGQTQHTYGAANTHAMAMVQLFLGNTGVAGGGVNALRGEPNVQGATDMAMTVMDLPGYLKWPHEVNSPSLNAWCSGETYADGYYTNKPKFMVSFLKSWYGDKATFDNDYGYDWLPKLPKNANQYSTIGTFERMAEGTMKGYFAWGQNPCHSTPNAKSAREAMCNLDWLVVADWFVTETASFWDAPDLRDKAADIQTEVYFLPAALIYEKPGTILNSGRWMQWRYKAVEPVDEAKTDLEMCDLIWTKLVELYQKEGGTAPEPILNMKWDYYIDGKIDFRPVAWELNGYTTADNKLLSGFANLKADGSTACGIWIYSGYYNDETNKMDPAKQPVGRRGHDDPGDIKLFPKWAFSWPANRRVIYNRASCDMNGKPWNPDKVLVEWDGTQWQHNDVPDFVFQSTAADGTTTPVPPNNKAFFMRWEQNACFFSYGGYVDMPIPEHYEPFESPTENTLNGAGSNPCLLFGDDPSVKKGDKSQYPYNLTTYGITEHWQTGQQTRSCPALDEAQPRQFCEISEELAAEKGIQNGDMVRIFNNRGSVKMNALVTNRIEPLKVNGETMHQIGAIHHWGWANMYSTGDVVNDLTVNVADPNSFIPEYKCCLVDIEKA